MRKPWLYQLNAVTHSYGGRTVLQIGALEVFAGEVLCLVGPTGAGKSTLLRLLAGLEAPTTGQVRFGDCCLGSQDVPLEVLRRITLVFQRPVLLAGTVRANVDYGLRLRGLDRNSSRVEEVLAALHLKTLAARSSRTLSGGETQLVALARALVLYPEVLLLDEPTANLDPARVALVEGAIAAAHRVRRTTIVWATHNLFQARRMAERVAFLLEGQLVEAAPAQEFFESPTDPRTGAFVRGKMVY
jgi:tungstate transport system ATP-binding protein